MSGPQYGNAMTDIPAETPAQPQSDAPRPDALFTWYGFVRGFRMATPLALSGVLFGMAFGVLAREAGL